MSRIGPFAGHLRINRGATYGDVLTLTGPDGLPFPLTGVTARMQIRDSTCKALQTPSVSALVTLTSAAGDGLAIDVGTGTITRTISKTRTLAVPATSRDAKSEVRLYFPDGWEESLLLEDVIVIDEITEPT